jgi:hypothetical protein
MEQVGGRPSLYTLYTLARRLMTNTEYRSVRVAGISGPGGPQNRCSAARRQSLVEIGWARVWRWLADDNR